MLKSAEHASMRKHHENPSTRVHLVVIALEKISKGLLRNSKTPESRENESGTLEEILSLLVIK